MNEKITLMLPLGYGAGTVVYDFTGEPYQAVSIKGASPIFEMVKIDHETAKRIIAQGAKVLKSTAP